MCDNGMNERGEASGERGEGRGRVKEERGDWGREENRVEERERGEILDFIYQRDKSEGR